MKARLMIVAMVLALAACGGERGVRSGERRVESGLEEVLVKEAVWQLVSVQGRVVDRRGPAVTLVFNREAGTLHGRAACNGYSGEWKVGSGKWKVESGEWNEIRIRNVEGGVVECPEGVMNAERRYLAALRRVDRVRVEDAGQRLLLASGERVLLEYELQ